MEVGKPWGHSSGCQSKILHWITEKTNNEDILRKLHQNMLYEADLWWKPLPRSTPGLLYPGYWVPHTLDHLLKLRLVNGGQFSALLLRLSLVLAGGLLTLICCKIIDNRQILQMNLKSLLLEVISTLQKVAAWCSSLTHTYSTALPGHSNTTLLLALSPSAASKWNALSPAEPST